MKDTAQVFEQLITDDRFIQWANSDRAMTQEEWYGAIAHNDQQEAINMAKSFVLNLKETPNDDFNADELLVDIHGQMDHTQTMQLRPTGRKWYAIAATIIILIGLGGYLLNPSTDYQTPYGEIQKIHLPDGSTAFLNANSSLDVVGKWQNDHDRIVKLQGEGYFDVTDAPKVGNRTFKVLTDNGTVEVLGTSFNVMNGDGQLVIHLTSGRIKYAAPNSTDAMILETGELLKYDFDTQRTQKDQFENKNYSAWTDKKIICNNMSLLDLSILVQRYYGVDIVWQNPSLQTKSIQGILPNKSIDHLIDIVSESFNIKVTKKNNTVVFG